MAAHKEVAISTRKKIKMKYSLGIFISCFIFLATVPMGHAEELQEFLKRTGTGNASTNDLHENFHMSVFVNGQTYEMNRTEIVKFWEQQKTSGIKLTDDNFTILSKTETLNDGEKSAVISVVTKASITENVRGASSKIESVSHFIVLRDSSGMFRLLYAVIPKQIKQT